MKSNEYAFTTHWRVPGTCQEISEILSNGPDLVRWWPSVYLAMQEWVNIIYDWRIRANKPLLRYLSFIMKPIFSANHHWAMR